MGRSTYPAGAVALAVTLTLSACGSGDDATPTEKPIAVEEIAGEVDLWRLTLTAKAADRLDIQTTTVAAAGTELVVPSAAVIIDPTGHYWVYTSPEPFVFLRQEIRPVREESQQAFFADGPPIGTPVVTRGVPELYGAEFGIGK